MSTYQTCKECGSDLTSAEEEEQELCEECQKAEAREINTDYCDKPFLDDGRPNPRYNPHPLYSRTK